MSGAPPPPAASAALGLACAGGRVLLLLRSREPYGGLWSLPGGKPEQGEGLEDACRRELAEELGVRARILGLRLLVDETLLGPEGARRWLLAIFAFRVPAGAALRDRAAWVPCTDLDALPMIATDRRFVTDALAGGPGARYRQLVARLDGARQPQVESYA